MTEETYIASHRLVASGEEVEIHRCPKCNGVFGIDASFTEADLREPPHAVCPMCVKDSALGEPDTPFPLEGERSGYDRYLDNQYRLSGGFMGALFEAITKADGDNTTRLSNAFPEEVDAYLCWTRRGVKEFVTHIAPDHALLDQFRKEYGLDESETEV